MSFFDDQGNAHDWDVIKEMVHGSRYVHPQRGIDIVIGVTSEVGETLGLMYECWEELSAHCATYQAESTRYHAERNAAKRELFKIKSLGFWKRLIRLFSGF